MVVGSVAVQRSHLVSCRRNDCSFLSESVDACGGFKQRLTMELGGVSRLLIAAMLAGCAETAVPPAELMRAVTVPVVTAGHEPPPPRVITLAERVRDEGWLTRFWEQLNPAQRRRVTNQLRLSIPPRARTEEEAAPIWDALGLVERDALIFGPGLHRLRSVTSSGVGADVGYGIVSLGKFH